MTSKSKFPEKEEVFVVNKKAAAGELADELDLILHRIRAMAASQVGGTLAEFNEEITNAYMHGIQDQAERAQMICLALGEKRGRKAVANG